MTLIASWGSADCKRKGNKLSAVYFCADSRITWPGACSFDQGQKVFGCIKSPEIFCYCGDAQFVPMSLPPLLSEIDSGVLFPLGCSYHQKRDSILDFFQQKLNSYPPGLRPNSTTIYYATCINWSFYMAKFCCNTSGITVNDISLTHESSLIFCDGSGSKQFKDRWITRNTEAINEHKTSRNVYRCMVECIEGDDLRTGGVPQLIGLFRNGKVQQFGIVRDGKRFFQGREVPDGKSLSGVEWRNDNYERVDPHTMDLLPGAQPQPFAC